MLDRGGMFSSADAPAAGPPGNGSSYIDFECESTVAVLFFRSLLFFSPSFIFPFF